ncbi:hypothetical protein FSARC_9039 [Fusarium sarcochroum]|uniref:Uncharacterized protein n=1 Tax=Fusarium sarcochroum TaxID=1208366 RepID=A0A8H4X5P9_9HYPO|nr:hypothetical protein FSARC_9039 [Fusarium sarcochroum]
MSSGYGSEASVDSDEALDQLEAIIEDLSRNPLDPDVPNLRFGHLTVPVYLKSRYCMVQELTDAVRQVHYTCPIIFITSRIEERLIRTTWVNSLVLLPKYSCQTLEYSWFLSILKDNRVVFGDGPEAWKPSEGRDTWYGKLVLPNKTFVVFSLDPDLSADCSLALIGLVHYFGCNLLSELVGVRSEYPVAHYELAIPTDFELIPERCVDDVEEDRILTRIRHRLTAGAADERHAVLFAPPYTGHEMFGAWSVISAIQFQWHPTGHHPKGVIIDVDADHPIPGLLNDYTHAHIVLGKRCMGRVFDEESSQVVLANLALTQGQRDALQWWCDQPEVNTENIWIYPGTSGLEPDGDVTVYRPVHVGNAQAGGFIAAVYAMSKWGVDVERVLPCFIKSPRILPEMTRRLSHQGIIQETNPRFALTGGQERVFEAILPLVRYDHRLAHFVALGSADAEVRRLKAQLAIFLVLKDDWRVEGYGEKYDARVKSWGWSKDLDSHGDLWRMLGLWKRISRDCQDFENLEPGYLFESIGALYLPNSAALYLREDTRTFEEVLNKIARDFDSVSLTPHNVRDETEVLSHDQLRQVMWHLLCAYLYQLVLTRLVRDNVKDGYRLEHVVYSTGTSVSLMA